jgi:hypothetical protein
MAGFLFLPIVLAAIVSLFLPMAVSPVSAAPIRAADPGAKAEEPAPRDCVPIPLTGGLCTPRTGQPTDYSFNTDVPYWMVFAVTPSGTDDKDAYVYTGPCATGTMLGYSNRTTGTDLRRELQRSYLALC